MKYISVCIITTLLLFSSAGGSQKAVNEPAPETKTPENAAVQPSDNIPAMPESMLKEGWPADSVPSELPEYTEGTVVNSGKDAEDTLYIKIRDTDDEKLEKYLDKLKDSGWIVTGGSDEYEAVNGLHTVYFEWQDGKSMLQMSLYTESQGSWPAGQIPPDILQPQTGTLVGEIAVLETGENMWYFNYTYDGIDEAAAQEYMELLMQNGWSGDATFLSKSVEWNGEKYDLSVEIYETVETRTTFTCNYYISN